MKTEEDKKQASNSPVIMKEEKSIDQFIFKAEIDSMNKFDTIPVEWKRHKSREEGSLRATIRTGRGIFKCC